MLVTYGSYDAIESLIVLSSPSLFSASSTILTLGRDSAPTIYNMPGRTGSVWPHFHENRHESGTGTGCQIDAAVELETSVG